MACKDAARRALHNQKYYERHKEEPTSYEKTRVFLEEIKAAPCTDCGHCFPSYVMDFDTIERLKKEIAKCELVCANCHRIRTYRRRKKPNLGVAMTYQVNRQTKSAAAAKTAARSAHVKPLPLVR